MTVDQYRGEGGRGPTVATVKVCWFDEIHLVQIGERHEGSYDVYANKLLPRL